MTLYWDRGKTKIITPFTHHSLKACQIHLSMIYFLSRLEKLRKLISPQLPESFDPHDHTLENKKVEKFRKETYHILSPQVLMPGTTDVWKIKTVLGYFVLPPNHSKIQHKFMKLH